MPGVCVFAVEDDRMGTLGTGSPSADVSCEPGIAADDEAISSSPPDLLIVRSGFKGFDVEDEIGESGVGASVGFVVEDAESAMKISILGYAYTLAPERQSTTRIRGSCDIP